VVPGSRDLDPYHYLPPRLLLSLDEAMAKRLFGATPHILYSRTIIPYTKLILARPVSTFQKMPKPCDLFEYTSGRWMYVAGLHKSLVLNCSADMIIAIMKI